MSNFRILILSSRLDLPGGIERVTVNAANLFTEKGNIVTLLILDELSQSFYPVHPTIKTRNKPLTFGIQEKGNIISRKIRFIRDIIQLKKIIKKLDPDIIINTEYQFSICTILAKANKKAKIISWEHHHFHWIKRNRFWNFLYHKTYPKLDSIVCQNTDEALFYEAIGCKTITIPYHLHIAPAYSHNDASNEILSIGWLIPRKGIDLLMEAANIILKKYPSWTWRVIGDGEMKESLLDFIKKNNLEGKLILQLPKDHNTNGLYKNASIFVMTSRSESFGMVIAEAMAHGLPAIAFDCETGPRHVITNNQDGFLVEKEDIIQLSKTISRLIEDPELRKNMGEKAANNMRRFSPDLIYQQWKEKIFT